MREVGPLKPRSMKTRFVLAFAAVVLTASALSAATLSGVVRDNSGSPIPGVTLTATRAGDASPAVAVTNGAGEFGIADLLPGSYTLEAALDGFQPTSKKISLTTGQTLELAFTIAPAFEETVEVVAEAVRTGEVSVLESRRQAPVVS